MPDQCLEKKINFVKLTELTDQQTEWIQKNNNNSVFGCLEWYTNIINFECAVKNNNLAQYGFLIVQQQEKLCVAMPVKKSCFGYETVSNFYCPHTSLFFDAKEFNEESAWTMLIVMILSKNNWIRFYIPTISRVQLGWISDIANAKNKQVFAAEYKKNYFAPYSCFEQYWDDRPSILKNTVRRKLKKISKENHHVVIKNNVTISDIEDYWRVYGNSWKIPEPTQCFINWLLQSKLDRSQIVLGFIYLEGVPIASQLWVIADNVASIFKLAQDKKYDALSPGTLLTYRMIQDAFQYNIKMIDFLLGDDDFKDLWMSEYRQFYNIELINNQLFFGKVFSALKLIKARHSAKHQYS